MANETTEILRIVFDADAAIKNTQELIKQRDALKRKGEELVIAEGKNSKAALENEAAVRVLNNQIREQKKVTDNIILSQKQAQGSNQALKAELSKLTSEYNRLSKEERNTSEAGLQLKSRIIDITNELKANESAIGNNFRNVGNYKSALEGIGGPIGNVTKGITGFNTTLKANPILAIVGLVNLFAGSLKKLQPVTDAINVALGALNSIFDVLIERVKALLSGDIVGAFTGIGDAISEAASAGSKYAKATKDISDAQQIQNINNAETAKQVSNLTIQLKDRTKTDQERLKIAADIAKIEQDNFKNQQKINQDNLKKEEDAVKLLLRQKGINTDRIKNTQDLIKLGQDLQLQDESFAKLGEARVKVIESEAESNNILERAQLRVNQITDASAERAAKAAEKRQAANEKEKAENEKRAAEILKLQDEFFLSERQKLEKSFDEKKKVLDANNADELKLIEQIDKSKTEALAKFDKEQTDNAAKAEKERQDKILEEKIKGINEQATLNDALLQNELAAVDLSVASEEEKARQKAEINLKYLQLQLQNVQALADADNTLTDIEKANIEKISLAITKAQNQVKALQESDPPKTIGQVFGATKKEADEIDATIQATTQAFANLIGVINAGYQRQIDSINEKRDFDIQAIKDSTLSEEEKKDKIEQLNKDAAQKAYQLQVKQFNADKALKLVTATIDIASAVIKNSFNPILAAITAGVGFAQLAIIASQKPPAPPKFADGVIGLKGAGNATSDSVPAMLSNGESVITASGTRYAEMNYPGLLQFLNTKNKFADGVVNFNQPNVRPDQVNIGEQIRLALQDLTIVTKVSDIEKASFDRQSVRSVGVI
jgi:hypothetical protein